jgi:hypothetical protein
VGRAGKHRALGAQALLEHVADGVEGGAVRARHDELRQRRPPERLERRVGLRRRALHHQRPHALLTLRRELAVGLHRPADHEAREPAQEHRGLDRADLREERDIVSAAEEHGAHAPIPERYRDWAFEGGWARNLAFLTGRR